MAANQVFQNKPRLWTDRKKTFRDGGKPWMHESGCKLDNITFSAIPTDATGIGQWSRGQLVGDPGCAKCLKKFKPDQVIVQIANLKGKGVCSFFIHRMSLSKQCFGLCLSCVLLTPKTSLPLPFFDFPNLHSSTSISSPSPPIIFSSP